MVIGVPKEVKDDEYRVALTPSGVLSLTGKGHRVLVQTGAGEGTHIPDREYEAAGAEIATKDEVWSRSELIVKVKEPQPHEWPHIRPGQILFTYFHLAANEELTRAMMNSGAVCIAYETVQTEEGALPLLTPMSEVAGRLSIQEGAKYLERPMGGRGILLSGVPGTRPATVTVIGAGTVGVNAVKIAAGFGAIVYCLDINLDRLRYLGDVFPNNVVTLHSNAGSIRSVLPETDLLIGAVYLPGARAPKLVSRADIGLMKPGTVAVDVCVDQGGCFETTRPTTHKDPVYVEEGVIHYAVANMPGAVAHTSTYALTNATLPYVAALAAEGLDALRRDPALRKGLNVAGGKLTLAAVGEQYGVEATTPEAALAA